MDILSFWYVFQIKNISLLLYIGLIFLFVFRSPCKFVSYIFIWHMTIYNRNCVIIVTSSSCAIHILYFFMYWWKFASTNTKYVMHSNIRHRTKQIPKQSPMFFGLDYLVIVWTLFCIYIFQTNVKKGTFFDCLGWTFQHIRSGKLCFAFGACSGKSISETLLFGDLRGAVTQGCPNDAN